MQFFFATPKHLHRVHSHFFMVVLGVAEGGFLFAHSHVSSVSIEVGTGFCPIWGIWRGAGTPATSQMRCWLLPNGRIFPRCGGTFLHWAGVLRLCFFTLPARRRNVGFSHCAAHTLAVGAESRTQRRHAPHGGERCLLRKGARMQNRSRRYPLTLLLRQAPEPLVGAALRKNAEISLCNFQRPL